VGTSPQETPPPKKPVTRTLLRLAGVTLLTVVIASALLLGLTRLLLPTVEHFRPQVQTWISTQVGRKVEIGSLRAGWRGWTPVLHLGAVRVFGAKGQELARFRAARVSVDVLGSLVQGSLRVGRLWVNGASFTVTRRADGSLAIAGMAGSGSAAGSGVARWLLAQHRLALEDATVIWHDERAQRPPLALDAVNIRLENVGTHHRLSGTGELPRELGRRLGFAADLRGDVDTPDWSGTVFLHGDGIASILWHDFAPPTHLRLASGTWSFSLWSDWRNAELAQAQGEVHCQDVLIKADSGVLPLDSGDARVLLRRVADGWQMDLKGLTLTTPRGTWPTSEATVRIGTAPGGTRRYRVTLGFLRLGDVVPLAAATLPSGELTQLIRELTPRGRLQDLGFALTPQPSGPPDFSLTGTLQGVSIQPTADIPGLEGLSGRLEIGPDHALLTLDSASLRARWPDRFPEPLAASVHGQIEWRREGDGWRLLVPQLAVKNPDVTAQLEGHLLWRAHQSPEVSLAADVSDGDLAALRNYVPKPLLPPAFAAWMEQAFQAGRIDRASLLVEGPLAAFPFDDGGGTFRLRTHIRDGVLAYGDGWPALEAYSGTVQARGRDVTIHLEHGTISGARVISAEGHIDGIGKVEPVSLRLQGKLVGDASQGLAFLRTSPLKARFGELIAGLEAHGETHLDLDLSLPLDHDEAERRQDEDVHGTLRFVDARVRSRRLDAVLEQVNGEARFTHDGLSAEGLDARYLDHAITLGLERGSGPGDVLRIDLAGTAGRDLAGAELRKLGIFSGTDSPEAMLLSRLNGSARWHARIELPAGGADTVPRVQVESTLAGLAVDLPEPLRKTRSEARELAIDMTLEDGGERRMRLRYGPSVSATVLLAPSADGRRVARGAILLGSGTAELPAAPGLGISGHVETLSADEWSRVLPALDPVKPPGAAPGAGTPLLRSVDLRVDRLQLLGRWFLDMQVDVHPQPAARMWAAELQGVALAGSASIPMGDARNRTVVARLDRLALTESSAPPAPPRYDPRSLPPLDISTRVLFFGDLNLGRAHLRTSPSPEGLHIDALELSSSRFDAKAQGVWRSAGKLQHTQAGIELQSDDLADLLQGFGYTGNAVRGGKTHIRIEANWPGAPSDFTLANLTGQLKLRITDGRLLELDKGTPARIFGLLSVQLLPRRLMLDFSDLFSEGFRYDVIKGDFSIRAGNAYTTDLIMQGPSARVEVDGRIDLANKTYDQTVTVVPKLTATLPLVPVWLAEKLLNREVFNESFARRYRVTGSWSDPKVEPIQEKRPPPGMER
jgi:uncharacterized protein (TIGR02099 family)